MRFNFNLNLKNLQISICSLCLVVLAACGGGGGSAGTPSGGSGSSSGGTGTNLTTNTITAVLSTPTVVVGILDSGGVPTSSIGGSGISTATAKLVDASGQPVAGRLVTFTADATLVRLSPASGSVLSDSNGVASIQISPFSFLVAGAGSIKATALLGNVLVSGSKDFQVSATNLVLRSLNVGVGSLAAFGNRAVSVQVTANGVPVSSPVQVAFTASCGSVSPASVSTDGAGNASTSYKADVISCAGTNVSISASSVGATPLTGQISVLATVATNIQFVSTAPAVIYLRDSGAATQAVVTFKVVDSAGNPQPNQALVMSLVNSGPGVSLDVIGANGQVTKTSDSAGNVSVAVFSGTVPTPVQVKAALVANTQISTTSGILTVASGRPVQKAASIASVKLSLEGLSFDGDTTPITLSLADRQGNPVPDGTVVNFVSQSGVMIPPTCVVTGGTSQCSSTIRSSGTRPLNGRVSVLAYVQGEEDFIDSNSNNVYDAGESFTDLGNAYRSDVNSFPIPSGNSDPTNYSSSLGFTFSVPRAGATSCSGGENGVANTCDGVWGGTDVRKQHLIIFASAQAFSSAPTISAPNASGTIAGFSILVFDKNGNSMPTGSLVAAEKASGSDECSVKKAFPSSILNTYNPSLVVVDLIKCQAGDAIDLNITSPVTKTVTVFRVRL